MGNVLSECFKGCDLVDDLIDDPLVLRFGLFPQYSDEASLKVLEKTNNGAVGNCYPI